LYKKSLAPGGERTGEGMKGSVQGVKLLFYKTLTPIIKYDIEKHCWDFLALAWQNQENFENMKGANDGNIAYIKRFPHDSGAAQENCVADD
jgi:hypothetical protein